MLRKNQVPLEKLRRVNKTSTNMKNIDFFEVSIVCDFLH